MKKVFVTEGTERITFHDGIEHIVVSEAEGGRLFATVEDKLATEIEKRFPGHFAIEDIVDKSADSEPEKPAESDESGDKPEDEPTKEEVKEEVAE